MTEQEYRAAEGVNKSTLWELRKSPAHYKYLLEHPTEDTQALRFGRALHAALLTPTAFKRDYVAAPAFDRRTKAGKAAYEEWRQGLGEGVTIMDAEELGTIKQMVKAYKATPEARALLRKSRREVPLFWRDREVGLPCKCRVDAITPETIIDVKTTMDGTTDAFRRDAMRYGYHVQAAHYLNGVETLTGRQPEWYFLIMEKKAPYGVHLLKASESFIELGAFERTRLLEQLKECMDTDTWPSYQTGELDPPEWAMYTGTGEV